MTQKGLDVLSAVIEHGLDKAIGTVVVGQDKAVENDFSNEIVDVCKKRRIPVCYRGERHESCRTGLAVGWRWILKDIPQLIVIHDSLLPRYRGFAPLVNALINGEKKIGATAILAAEAYDTGPILEQRSVTIKYPVTIREAIDRVAKLYAKMAVSIVRKAASGQRLKGKSQNEKHATYSLWRDELDYRIDWRENAQTIERFVDAVGYPYSGAQCKVKGRLIVVRKAKALADLKIANRHAGKVIFVKDSKPVVVCGKGLIRIDEAVFLENGQPVLPLENFRTRFE